MITYVNTVLVGTGVGTLASNYTVSENETGKYIVVNNDGTILDKTTAATAEAIKVGIKTDNGIKWSNIIKKADIKSYHITNFSAETEDKVYFDFSPAAAITCATKDAEPVRVVVRLTFKDMDTRYRKWSESFEVIANVNDSAADIANAFVAEIMGKGKARSRMKSATVVASKTINEVTFTNALCLEAKKYDDDNTTDSISPANKVRFTGNAWYTRPEADGFETKNKYSAAIIAKEPGSYPTGSWKLVRDAEAQAMGYQGILNRGEGTWPIIKPEMNVVMKAEYDSITLEFENMYRTADDLQRRTKQTLQIFEQHVTGETQPITPIQQLIEAFISGKASNPTAADIAANTIDVND